MRRLRRLLAALALGLAAVSPAQPAQEPPGADPTDILNTLLAGLLGFRETTGAELQQEVAEIGGIPFLQDVPLDYMTRDGLSGYLQELLDAEYPMERAEADRRTLVAFGLLDPATDLRALRGRLLLENVAGFYDERPGRRRLYVISRDRDLTPANQLILSHELRHALQDQYVDVHSLLPRSVGDFDDRRMAFLSLLEGDATLVMERFLARRLGTGEAGGIDLGGLAVPGLAIPGAPPVLRDQLLLPYLAGREFAQALWQNGGWSAIRQAWARPPRSTEQVLHPSKYFAGEEPREIELEYAPPRGRLLNEGVLGEMFVRTLLGDGSDAAAAGWGGDRFRVWDVAGRTLLLWRATWDTAEDAREFLGSARAALDARHGGRADRDGFSWFAGAGWSFAVRGDGSETWLLASDAPELLAPATAWVAGRARPARPSASRDAATVPDPRLAASP